jgi:hypothetical protein
LRPQSPIAIKFSAFSFLINEAPGFGKPDESLTYTWASRKECAAKNRMAVKVFCVIFFIPVKIGNKKKSRG